MFHQFKKFLKLNSELKKIVSFIFKFLKIKIIIFRIFLKNILNIFEFKKKCFIHFWILKINLINFRIF